MQFTFLFRLLFLTFFLSTITNLHGQITTFAYTGAPDTYIVPPGVTSIQIEVWGAQGQAITDEQYDESTGGFGGYAIGELTVVPGEVLNVYVGGMGTETVAGFNGGALGGNAVASDGDPGRAGSGGGASDVRQGGSAYGDRVIIGGGGGGGGRDYVNGWCQPCGTGGNGGIGGLLIGGDGDDPFFDLGFFGLNPGSGGNGGTQLAGGAAGDGPEGPDGNAGALGVGGEGVDGNFSISSGGGGGGYYGGGSGAGANWGSGVAAGGGAGGSSFIGGVTSASTDGGIRSGNGQVTITVLCEGLTYTVTEDEICEGEEITLDATSSSGATISWDLGVVDGVAFTPVGTGIITYTATSADPSDCVLTVDIIVNAVPTVTLTVDDDEICDGESVIFTGGGDADTYSWDPVDVVDGVSYFPASTGTITYSLTGTFDITSCESTATVDVTMHALPTVTASVDFIEICLGEDVVFTGGGATTYIWDMGVSDGVAFTPASIGTTTYNVIGTDGATTCENTASIDVTVNDTPIVTATADDDEVCDGETITLTGGGAATYVWDLGVTDGTSFAPPVGTTTYTVIGSTISDCEGSTTIDITVHALPTVTASVDDAVICLGQDIIFTGGGADTYSWDMGVTDGIAFTPASIGTTTYIVTGTDGSTDCENTASVDVTVEAVPTVTASVDFEDICEGETVTFTGGGADTYTWDMGVTDGVAFTPGAGTVIYTVTGTDASTDCENTASVSVTVHETPSVTANATTEEVCLGESVTLTGGGASTYIWDGGVINGGAFTPEAMGTTTYTVIGTSDFDCDASATITISVIDCEPVTPAISLKTPVCVGDCFTILDASTGGTVTAWEWDFGGAADPVTSTEQNPIICVTTAGTYTIQLTVTSSTGAISVVTSTLNVFDNPSIIAVTDTIIDIGNEVNLIAITSSSSGTFNWTPENDIDCPDCQITTANPIESTTYTVTLIDQNGCIASDTLMVLVNFIEGVGVPSAFSPNNDGINDILFVKGYALRSISFVVYNRYGEVVFQTTDQSIGWDGTFKNRDENPGIFTWVLHYDYFNGEKGMQKGNTTLFR